MIGMTTGSGTGRLKPEVVKVTMTLLGVVFQMVIGNGFSVAYT